MDDITSKFDDKSATLLKIDKTIYKNSAHKHSDNSEDDTSFPDQARAVSFAATEKFQCKKCGCEFDVHVKPDICDRCGTKLKENLLSRSMNGRLDDRSLRRMLTEKRRSSVLKRSRLKKGQGQSIRVKDQREAHIREARNLLTNIENYCKKVGFLYSMEIINYLAFR